MRQESLSFLTNYLNNNSPVGFESPGQRLWLDYVTPFVDETFTDVYGTAAAIINPGADYKVVIEAHADEISWYVSYISESGFIYLKRNGGSDYAIAPSMRAKIHTPNGTVNGIFGWPAIHVRDKNKEESPGAKNVFIDVGCSKREEVVNLGIEVGCIVTFDADMMTMNDKWIVGRALDNRVGGFMIAEVARKIKENGVKLPYSLYIVNAVQEEVGLRGAAMIANRIAPDVAIITDVTHDTTAPMYDKQLQGERSCGKGPVLTYGPAIQNNVLAMLFNVAKNAEIPVQRTTVSGATGTDTDSFAYSGNGVASALISLALRYMHTTVEMVHSDDIEGVIELMYQFLTQLPAGHDFRYIK